MITTKMKQVLIEKFNRYLLLDSDLLYSGRTEGVCAYLQGTSI